ncbi:MAG: hypothetical protein KJ572_04780 [Gammaproteobacteria bacterium]|nr:hypothetical protein [Sideroxydans sp.]MBU3903146.1 hypothetical protein [Gammaproteobacteria bacterium]MBU4045639.1 hypothetical protein [Gammaproteobacteria bacterium]
MQTEQNITENDEINLKDIFRFFKDNGKLIAICAVLGFLLAFTYVKLAPKKYETTMLVQMAQIGTPMVSIESPATLTERLRYPGTFIVAVLNDCGVADRVTVGEYLGGMLKTSVSKVMPNVLTIKVRALTPESAQQCAESLLVMIAQQQRGLIAESLMGRKEQLAEYQQAIADEMRQLETIRKTEAASFGYLAKLDKLTWLRTRIDALQEEGILAYQHPAKLVMPLMVSPNPVSPKVMLSLLLGVVLGGLLGVAIALGKRAWRIIKE